MRYLGISRVQGLRAMMVYMRNYRDLDSSVGVYRVFAVEGNPLSLDRLTP